jgi:hypothetical protein
MEASYALWLPAYSEMEQLAGCGQSGWRAKVLAERIHPLYLAIGEDCSRS